MTNSIIDISHWDYPVDFGKVSGAGIIAIIAKATQGTSGIDQRYDEYRKEALPHGFLWGSFHFGTGDDLSSQVTHYLDTVKPEKDELVCLDFEENPNGSSMTLGQAQDFVTLFEKQTGRYPVLYAGEWLKESLQKPGSNVGTLAQCPLWMAQYASAAVIPSAWASYTLWQYTESEQGIAGIKQTDRNRFNGSDAALKQQWPFT